MSQPASSRVGSPALHGTSLPSTYRKKTASKQFPREVYLRTDLSSAVCSIATTHSATSHSAAAHPTLNAVIESLGVLSADASHYIIPSYYALARFHEIFSHSTSLLHIILLRTHLMRCTKVVERRMSELLSDLSSTRRCVFFENEHHVSCATKQLLTETTSERHSRAERRAAKWLAKQMMLSDIAAGYGDERREMIYIEEQEEAKSVQEEEGRREEAKSEKKYPRESDGITIHSMASYLQWLQQTHSAPTSSSSSSAAVSEDEPSRLLRLYNSLIDLEYTKLKQKAAAADAEKELQAMLASLKLNWTRHTSEGSVKFESGDEENTPRVASSPIPSDSPTARSASLSPSPSPISSPSTALSDLEYEEHLPLSVAQEAVARGLLYRGHIHVNKHHPSADASLDLGGRMIDSAVGGAADASTTASSVKMSEIFISGMVDRNRAIDGDEVVVQLLPPAMWRAPTTRKVLAVSSSQSSEKEGDENSIDNLDSSSVESKAVPTGRVVAILQRHTRPYVATLQLDTLGGSGSDFSLVVPMNECIPKIRIRTHQVTALAQQRLLVRIDGWDQSSKYPSGIYIQSLGPINELETGIKCILYEHDISYPSFSRNMLRTLPERDRTGMEERKYKVGSGYHSRGEWTPFTWTIPEVMLKGRRDLRQTHNDGAICSIDPIGCEDIDDALSCRTLPNGNIEIGVHIADVSTYITAGSLLDQEASRRATSVYLVDRRLDMLPSTLSSDLCSLRGGCDRLCISVMWEMNLQTGEVLNTWYGKTVIYNSYALSYEEAQYIYDTEGDTKPLAQLPRDHEDYNLTLEERYDKAPQSSLTKEERKKLFPKIKTLLILARQLREKRLTAGALELDSLTMKFRLDSSDKSKIEGIQNEPNLEVHSTIAEWMVFANSTIAYHIYKAFPQSALLRHHPYPAPTRFTKLLEMAEALGVKIDITSNKSLAESLRVAEEVVRGREWNGGEDKETVKKLIKSNNKNEIDSTTPLDSHTSKHWIIRILKELAARAMSEAQYFSTGSVTHVKEFYHYGLSANYYTHFTSPIRRYADLIVHRQIMCVIEKEEAERKERKLEEKRRKRREKGEAEDDDEANSTALVPSSSSTSSASTTSSLVFTNDQISTLSHHLNSRNRSAKIASMESQDLFLSLFLQNKSKTSSSCVERCEAMIVSLRQNGFIVVIPKYHVKGAVILVDKNGISNVTGPNMLNTTSSGNAENEDDDTEEQKQRQVKAKCVYDEKQQSLTMTMLEPLTYTSDPSSSTPSQPPLPLTHTFHIFSSLLIDISLRTRQSRYRIAKPVFRLVWHEWNEKGREQAMKSAANLSGVKSTNTAAIDAPASASSTSFNQSSDIEAPAGAKKLRHQPIPHTLTSPSSLYSLFRNSSVAPVAAVQQKLRDTVLQEEKQMRNTGSAGVDQKLANRSTPRVRLRHSGALGGRLLFTPNGTIPNEMMKATMILGAQHDEYEEEGEY